MAVPSATRPPSRGSPGVLTLDVVARQRYDKYLRTHACLIKLVPFRVKAQIRPSIKLLQCPARVAGTINLNSSACLYHQRRRQLWGDNKGGTQQLPAYQLDPWWAPTGEPKKEGQQRASPGGYLCW